ncbi:hypothetical protein F511_06182 [Dorcoceras hygrometricum]|uniref:Uncharacterized protein n=1 Tax=Dorcoceras hygrometricum TaxID=472368 RepID=A0A2Z7CIT3_9LAMI|nr:hypothetical protein F511_06182 [Dorcoceras hygrometricum]
MTDPSKHSRPFIASNLVLEERPPQERPPASDWVATHRLMENSVTSVFNHISHRNMKNVRKIPTTMPEASKNVGDLKYVQFRVGIEVDNDCI